jgi:nitrite reductase/ring-hydroxylating ferredoxin subunit
MTENALPRRSVVALAGVGVAIPLLAACAASGEVASDPNVTPTGKATKGTKGTSKASKGATPSGTQLASTTDIPVGGAAVFSSQAVVVTQPTAGEFKCFSSVCTHAGCSVAAGETLDCPCHGSKFSITDGSVLQGPASVALPEKTIAVSGGEIFLQS